MGDDKFVGRRRSSDVTMESAVWRADHDGDAVAVRQKAAVQHPLYTQAESLTPALADR